MTDKTYDDVPEGWYVFRVSGDHINSFDPLCARMKDGVPVLGFRVRKQHINLIGICHGGIIAALADLQVLGAQQMAGMSDRSTPTISLSLDFLSPARLGTWVEMRAELLHTTPTLLFSRALIYADDTLVARSNGVFKLGKASNPARHGQHPLFQ